MKNKQNDLAVPLAEALKCPDLSHLLGAPLMAETVKDGEESWQTLGEEQDHVLESSAEETSSFLHMTFHQRLGD